MGRLSRVDSEVRFASGVRHRRPRLYTYDDHGLESTIMEVLPDGQVKLVASSVRTYDAHGNELSDDWDSDGDGGVDQRHVYQYAYDAHGTKLTEVDHKEIGAPEDVRKTFGADGNVLTEEHTGALGNFRVTYTYERDPACVTR